MSDRLQADRIGAAEAADTLVENREALADLCRRLSRSPAVALDTEFHSERRFWPELFLIQLADTTGAWLVDPLAVRDLSPLRALVSDPAVVKVMHSSRNDIAILRRYLSCEFAGVFDTQLAAAFLGYGEQCSLYNLLQDVCGIRAVAERTGAELVPFDHVPFDMVTLPGVKVFREIPVPRPVREADVYIGMPKMKAHVHTLLTCALKLQFGNLPDYDWMNRCHRDDIYQKIVNLTRVANPKWFLVDSLYACQGNGPFSAYPQDLIRDFNTILAGADPVAVDTVCEAIMGWENPGSVPATRLAAAEGLGTNRLEEIEIVGRPIEAVKRPFARPDTTLQGVFPKVNVVIGAACEPGCRALVRMALDALYVDGTLDRLQRPLTIFVGKQFEPLLTDVEGDVIVYGDCAQEMCRHYPHAAYWGSTEKYPHCSPIWSNLPDVGLVAHVHSLVMRKT